MYRILLSAHNSSQFDSWVELIDLVKEITEIKVPKTAGGLISLPFRCGDKIFNLVEVPQYVKFRYTKSQKRVLSKKSVEIMDFNPNS